MLALGLVLGVASLCAGQAFASEVPAGELQQWTDGAKLPFGLQTEIPELVLVGDPDRRRPNTLNVHFPDMSGRKLLEACPRAFAPTGSACHADREEASTILTSIGIDPDQTLGAVRLSVGRDATIEDAEIAATSLVAAWRLMRQSSSADKTLIAAV